MIINSIFGKLNMLAASVTEWFETFLGNVITSFTSLFPKLIYLQITFIMQIIDIFQVLFKKLAGLDVYYISESSEPQTGDFLNTLIREILVKDGALNNAFWGLVIIGIVLLFLSTMIAVLRAHYNTEEGKAGSISKPIGFAFKAIASFVIVPVSCIFGIYLANIILVALDQATTSASINVLTPAEKNQLDAYELSDGTETYYAYDIFGIGVGTRSPSFSGVVFQASAYRANRVRNDDDLYDEFFTPSGGGDTEYTSVNFGIFMASSQEDSARKIDSAFANCYKLATPRNVNLGANNEIAITNAISFDFTSTDVLLPVVYFSKYRVGLVWYYYNLWLYDFIIALGSIVTMFIAFINIIMGLMRRIIDLAILTIISPGVIGIMPLDNGEALKKWRQSFIKKAISAYGYVVGINLLYLLFPIISTMQFFPPALFIVNALINALFIIVGLVSVKDLTKFLSEIIGAENAYEVGEGLQKSVGSTITKIGALATPMGSFAKKVFQHGGILGGVGAGVTNRATGFASRVGQTIAHSRVGQGVRDTFNNIADEAVLRFNPNLRDRDPEQTARNVREYRQGTAKRFGSAARDTVLKGSELFDVLGEGAKKKREEAKETSQYEGRENARRAWELGRDAELNTNINTGFGTVRAMPAFAPHVGTRWIGLNNAVRTNILTGLETEITAATHRPIDEATRTYLRDYLNRTWT